MERAVLNTSDGIGIIGNYWHGEKSAVLLLHMMPATKESYTPFAKVLHSHSFSVLAIDLRGHGESMKGRDYKSFSDEEHQASIQDVDAAVRYLKKKGADNIFIVGASIGANLALHYQSMDADIKKTVLLSPGTNYRGILTLPSAKKLQLDQEVFLVAGSLDGRSAGRADTMAREIAEALPGKQTLKILPSGEHGTNLFMEDESLMTEITEWLL